MSGTVRGKFYCSSVTYFNDPAKGNDQQRNFTFTASYDTSIPEDARYAKYSPSANIQITVDNPAIDWEVGKCYYFDVSPVPEEVK